jgi:predicted ribosome quality control (RQC) complex YloA/Tae2 family protein
MKPQLADSLVMVGLAREMNERLSDGTVRRVLPAGKQALVIEVAVRSGVFHALINWQPGIPRVHIVPEVKPSGEESSFVGTLRRQLQHATVIRVRQMAFDRILIFELTNLANLGPTESAHLVVEATGRQPNCLLVARGGMITAVARPTPHRSGLYRVLGVGKEYRPPPGHDKLDPRRLADEQIGPLAVASDEQLSVWLRRTLQGISNTLLEELCARASLCPNGTIAELPLDWTQRLANAIAEIFEEAGRGRAWLYLDERGQPALAYPIVLRHLPHAKAEQIGSLSEGLALVAQRMEQEQERQRLRDAVQRVLRDALARQQKVFAERQKALEEAQSAELWRTWGELLIANLHALGQAEPGSAVEVIDHYSPTQQTISVPLLPGMGPKETAAAYFTRYRRAKRARDKLPALLEEARREIDALEAKLREAETAIQLERLRKLADKIGVTQAASSRRSARAKGADVGHTTAPSGHVVLYGRSSAENDAILRMAQPEDIWLHARGVSGAHVLIRTHEAPDKVPRQTLLWAARIAGNMSDYKPDGIADVDYTLAKYVRKPKGSPPGFVIYTHQKTLRVDLADK